MEVIFDFRNPFENHELFSNKNEKVIGKFKIKTSEKTWIDECFCLRSKAYTFMCNGENTNKIKGINKCHSKNKILEEYKKCLDGETCQ